ncbi:MAG: efflux RND transporter periplasmic adaptor subunit [Acidobacteria bacterium]|nr:efflux RND transporter periplasmic adaptor subunit [Acidobacteriota bacterium]
MPPKIVSADVDAGHTDLYTCSMHPHVLQHEPGDCPICRMDLVPVETEATAPAASPGVRVNRGFLQSFGVRTTRVERGALPVAIRTVGTLAHNERNVFSVNTKFGGWIERARVNNVGERVTAGEVLFEIYSPDLVTTQHEHLTAMNYLARLRERDAHDGALLQAASLVDAVRARLLYADMTAQQIEALQATRQVSRTVEFLSPASGFIVEKTGDSLEGMRLERGMTVLKIADHSTLWVEVEFFERDIRHLREGQGVSVTVDAFPGRHWDGAITFFRPAMNPGTRTLTAFVEVDNADLRLRPRMFATVELAVPGAADALLVPADAVLHSGDQAVVVVARGDGYFTPREVRPGLASDGLQQVTEGLDGGEEIVVSSQFLIDSESNLQAAIAQLLGERAEAGSGR